MTMQRTAARQQAGVHFNRRAHLLKRAHTHLTWSSAKKKVGAGARFSGLGDAVEGAGDGDVDGAEHGGLVAEGSDGDFGLPGKGFHRPADVG
jgi:hypothetical protein